MSEESTKLPIGANQVVKFAAEALTVLAIGSYTIGFIIVVQRGSQWVLFCTPS